MFDVAERKDGDGDVVGKIKLVMLKLEAANGVSDKVRFSVASALPAWLTGVAPD